MTVGGLIALLQQFDPAARVVLACHDGGYDDIGVMEPIFIVLNVNTFPGAGPHDVLERADKCHPNAISIAPWRGSRQTDPLSSKS